MTPFEYSQIIDISLPLYTGMPVYPGNPEFEIIERSGKTSVHSRIVMGTHTGTHVDSPRHVKNDGKGIDALALSIFIGPCRVLDCTSSKQYVSREDIERHAVQGGERVLLKTHNSSRGFHNFYNDYVYLDPTAAEYLAEKKVALVGIDSFSVKRRGESDNRPHTSLLSCEIPIFEGLNLAEVTQGNYFFIGFPLNIKEGNGAPVRVILLS